MSLNPFSDLGAPDDEEKIGRLRESGWISAREQKRLVEALRKRKRKASALRAARYVAAKASHLRPDR